MSYRVSKVLSKVVVNIVLSTYSGDRMPTKRLKPPSYRICCGLKLKPPDAVTEVGHLPPYLVHLRYHVLHER